MFGIWYLYIVWDLGSGCGICGSSIYGICVSDGDLRLRETAHGTLKVTVTGNPSRTATVGIYNSQRPLWDTLGDISDS